MLRVLSLFYSHLEGAGGRGGVGPKNNIRSGPFHSSRPKQFSQVQTFRELRPRGAQDRTYNVSLSLCLIS
jgi:hypothetical protein